MEAGFQTPILVVAAVRLSSPPFRFENPGLVSSRRLSQRAYRRFIPSHKETARYIGPDVVGLQAC